jgi:hypothetical protein
MTSETLTTFLGIPIDGAIVRGERKPDQRPLEELAPLMQAVLDDPLVTEFGWTQFTPYFNDGDPCVFSTRAPWFRTAAEVPAPGDEDEESDDESDDEDRLTIDHHPTLGTSHWNGKTCRYVDVKLSPDRAVTSAKCKELSGAIEGGTFDVVLLDAFGDHAEITVKRTGITVDFYDHD